jgi:hypothetical protein
MDALGNNGFIVPHKKRNLLLNVRTGMNKTITAIKYGIKFVNKNPFK